MEAGDESRSLFVSKFMALGQLDGGVLSLFCASNRSL